MPKKIVVVSVGGIGDVLLAIPTYKALREKYPESKIIVFGFKRHLSVLKNLPYIDVVRPLNFWGLLRNPVYFYTFYFNRKFVKYYVMEYHHISLTWAFDKSVKEIIGDIFDLELRNPKIELFFTAEQEKKAREMLAPYKNVIIMHIHSRTSRNHSWILENWVELVRRMPAFTFVQLGHADEPYVDGAVDWRGKTSLFEAFCLIKHATSFVGIDSCHAHATNAFDIPGVVLFGDSSPVHFGHSNNINVFKNLPCCCYYELWGAACPYSNECMHLITVDEVEQALAKQLKSVNIS